MSKKKNNSTNAKVDKINSEKDNSKQIDNNKISNDKITEKIIDDLEKLEKTKKDKKNEQEISRKISGSEPIKISKRKNPIFLNILSFLVIISCGLCFIISLMEYDSMGDIINGLLMLGISIFFVSSALTNSSKKKGITYMALITLIIYQTVSSFSLLGIINWPTNTIGNFVGKSLTDVIEWSNKHNIDLTQEYEYSDLIQEYHVIYQDVDANTKLKDVKKLAVMISEGPNPYKEIVIPNMLGWKCEDVLNFIDKNHLTNVVVDFVQADENENTLIEQSKNGNIKRNEEIKFVFSFGPERRYSEIKLSDLTNKTKFEAEFYLKQFGIKYEFDYDFSDKIKRGNIISQSIKPGTTISISGDDVPTLKLTISKGAKIVVPNLTKMTTTEITEWVIKNNLKLEFKDKYDESIKENSVIEANYKNGDIVEEGTLITVILSKGKLTMKKFDSFAQFREWADTYGIKYEEQHEFSSSVNSGEVIKYSYNEGATIKNNDVVIVTISDGKKIVVPNVIGLTKEQASNKLNDSGLRYNFVYKYSNSVQKGKVISQSISSGSEVSQGTTVTVTLSNGEKPVNTPTTPVCTPKTYTVGRNLNNIFSNYSGFDTVKSQLYSFFASNYPDVKISVVGVDGGDATGGSYIGGIGPGDSVTSCNSSPYVIKIAK